MKTLSRCMCSLTLAVLLAGVVLPFVPGSDSVCWAVWIASVRPSDLCCEYLHDPLGIDVTQPRLSWKLTALDEGARGQQQTAYRVLVASTQGLLDKNRGDLWDSDMVASDQSVHVVYAGKPLTSGTACYWKVCVKDEDGVTSRWSEPPRWTMGLLDESDWSAQWIGCDEVFVCKEGVRSNNVPDPWLRKTFTLEAKPERATVYVASVGFHELYVNGEKVGDAVLVPSVVNYRKRVRYVTYEIADCLKEGENVIGLWLGVSWSIYPKYERPDRPQMPIVLAQAEMQLPGGKTVRFATDETWRTHTSPNTLLGTWYFFRYDGEVYDANKEVPDWSEGEFDDSGWEAATVYAPSLKLSAEMIEPNRRIRAVRPVAIEESKPGVYRVDLGILVSGLFEMDLHGEPGQTVEMRFSEHPNADKTYNQRSQYIIGPSGKGTFCNRFNYFTGRWVTIEGLTYRPQLSDMCAHLVHTDYAVAADFECSNELLNWIHDATLLSFEDLSLGGYVVDCAHRERMGYGGDAHATTECGLNNYSLGAFYTKWSQD